MTDSVEWESNVSPFTPETAAARLMEKHGDKAAGEALRQAHICFENNLYGIGQVWHAAMRLIETRAAITTIN